MVTSKGGGDSCQLEEFLASPGQYGKNANGLIQLLEYVAGSPSGPRELPDTLSHYIDQDERIWEFIKGQLRVAWFYDEGQIIICTHCFVKASQKTPAADKRTAIEAKQNYLKAKKSKAITIIEDHPND